MLGVSGMTIRRDLIALESRGVLKRTHGGAVASETQREVFDAEEPIFELRRRKNAGAKARMAAVAARMLKPRWIVPSHYGTFPALTGTPEQLKEELARQGVASEVVALEPGGVLE